MAGFTYHTPGVLSKVRSRDGKRIYYAQVWWNGKRYTEKAGQTERQAVTLLGKRHAEVDAGTYVPPRDRKQAARAAAKGKANLEFDAATKAFLDACVGDYANPSAIRGMIARLGKMFSGRHLDSITHAELDDYVRMRMRHEGPFKKWTRRTGLRSPQQEIVLFSQVYRHLQDRGVEIENPVLRPNNRGRQRKGKATTYRPERVPVVPTLAALGAILTTHVDRMTDHDHALIALAYATGGRPESDLLRLRICDVALPDEEKVRTLDGEPPLGRVHFRDPKTPAGERTIPLHPIAATALRTIIESDTPDDALIFPTASRKGEARSWDRHSYRKTWANVIEEVAKNHPEVTGMVLRDLRRTFRTYLTNARIPEPTIMRMMGHRLNVSQSYHELTDEAAVEAIRALPVPPQLRAQVVVGVAVPAVQGRA